MLKKIVLDRKKPLCFYDDKLLLSENEKLFSLNLCTLELRFLASIPSRRLYSFLSKSRYLHRLLRLGVHSAVYQKEKVYFVYSKRIYSFDTSNNTITAELVFKKEKGPLVIVAVDQLFGEFRSGLYYGEYFNNPDRKPVNIYFKERSASEWTNVFTFAQGTINHIHSIIPDPVRNRMWILTGDFDGAAGIWAADMNFDNVRPVATGKQMFRTCVAFPTQQGLLYATDSQLERNYICLLSETKDGWQSRILYEINGSCIYGVKGKGYYVFSTSTEPGMEKKSILLTLLDRTPGPGILKNESHLILLDNQLKMTIVGKKKKDWLPYRLFQFGTFMFPSGDNQSKYLFSYNVANKGNDLCTEMMDISEISSI